MINIQKELKSLKLNVEYNINKYCRKDFDLDYWDVFRNESWLLTFPFNYIGRFEADTDLVRKIAVINCLYSGMFLKDDLLSDDPRNGNGKCRTDVRTYCYVKLLNILATRQYVYQCGEIILKYLFMYEEIYYSSLVKEKNLEALSVSEVYIPESLNIIGQKLLPLAASFAGYCILKDRESLIPKCEELIVDYQIAKQLFKDINMIKGFSYGRDSSRRINQVPGINNVRNVPAEEICEQVADNNLDLLMINTMKKYLKSAMKSADELNFDLMKHEILMMKESVEIYEKC